MHGSWKIILVLLLLWGQDSVRSIRLIDLRVPAHAAVGGEALLGCQFDMEGDLLYSVKWYKDGREFYRYIPKNLPEQMSMWFERPDVTVDLSRSSSDMVTLTNLQPESAGVYRCEVSGEAPVFALAADEKYVTIHVLPKTGPRISGLRYEYEIGDRVSANCSTPGSRPEAQLKWLVNNKPVHRTFLRGPWHRVVQDPPDTIETTLGLHYMVLPSHYRNGVMQIKCQAMIAPLYQREKVFILNKPEPEIDSEEEIPEEPSPQPVIPSLDEEPPPGSGDDEDREIRENLVNRFLEVSGQLGLPVTTISTTTEVSEASSDNASAIEKTFKVILAVLLVLVILF